MCRVVYAVQGEACREKKSNKENYNSVSFKVLALMVDSIVNVPHGDYRFSIVV